MPDSPRIEWWTATLRGRGATDPVISRGYPRCGGKVGHTIRPAISTCGDFTTTSGGIWMKQEPMLAALVSLEGYDTEETFVAWAYKAGNWTRSASLASSTHRAQHPSMIEACRLCRSSGG